MEIKQLEYFRSVVESGTISAAARKLNLSQPPLSFQMKKLEEELGLLLFERGRKEIHLTEAGRLLYQKSGDLLRRLEALEFEVKATGQHPILRIGATPTTISLLIPMLKKFQKEHPHIHYELWDENSYRLNSLLKEEMIDVALLRSPVFLETLESRLVQKENMVAVFHKQSYLLEKASLTEVSQYPLIVYRRYQNLIVSALEKRHLKYQIICLCDDGRDAIEFAKLGNGIAIVPASLQVSDKELQVLPLQEKDLETEILLAWNAKNLSLETNLFLSYCVRKIYG
ncbi:MULTISPECIES: LysR family transcriptional regulator [Terrabacteria group]|uniref:LysR family transcriptional regulator n=1 Tax=Bacillati TaxID=1783272 RepID=UPI001C6F211A|nr:MULTISPECIES: LysR family transcriptional regulator [Terrabacteria group]MBW9212877.1 LysR family transcriptional regulator [Trueperella sp. zg.1013]